MKFSMNVRWIHKKWSLTLRILPLVFLVILLKLLFHFLDWEIIQISPLLTSLLGGTVFLMGFLLSGVLADYKESEKIPNEIVCSFEALADSAWMAYTNKKSPFAFELLGHLDQLAEGIKKWFFKKERTKQILQNIEQLNHYFAALDLVIQPAFVIRMQNEQNNLRRLILRIHTIRETSFIQSGYAIAEVVSFLLGLVLLLCRLDPFYESLLFIGPIAYLFIYILALIRDLDNPFDYDNTDGSAEEISLHEFDAMLLRLKARCTQLNKD